MKSMPHLPESAPQALRFGQIFVILFACLFYAGNLFAAQTPLRFSFDTRTAMTGYTQVSPEKVYSDDTGFGFESAQSANAPGRFSVTVPEGNYRVTVVLGDADREATTTVKAETGRLMLESIHTNPGQFETRTFLVNVRTPALSPGNQIKLDVREWDAGTGKAATATWDNKLTLQFSGIHPSVRSVEIQPVEDAITVFLIGDSTVTDQASEPYGTWGQQLPRWFKPTVAIANHAESGQTLKAFRFQRRWDKVMAEMKPGDYVFMQFGHNDLNQRGHDAMWPIEDKAGDWINTHSEANTDYKWLLAAYAAEVKRRGGIAVIVSPMTKVDLRSGLPNIAGLGDYPKAAREAASLSGAILIDLNTMSLDVVGGLGQDKAPKAYVDGLHTNTYGGYLYSRCIVQGIKQANMELARHLVDDAGTFDPVHPQPSPDDFTLPLDPPVELPRPPGMPPRTSPTK